MSYSSIRLTAALAATAAAAGGLAAASAAAHPGNHRGPNPPPHHGTAPSLTPQADAPARGVDPTSPRVAGRDTWLAPGVRRGRSFRVTCDYVKTAPIDPVLFPGQEPTAHAHQFFGARTVAADSTAASLVAANANRTATSCTATRDGSAYWQDALLITDNPASPAIVTPTQVRVRYSAPRHQRVRAFPAGFAMVAGDPAATTLQPAAGWRCQYDRPRTPLRATPPQCAPGEALVGVVRFPNCWNGTALASTAPSQPHVATRSGRRCPASHPVALPEVTHESFWATDGQPHSYALSGTTSPAGIHAGFINGWDQAALRTQVRRWLNRKA